MAGLDEGSTLEARVAALEVASKDALPARDGDAAWVLVATALVFFMQAGFAMLEVGSVQIKNTKHILLKNIFDASLAAVLWWATGYAFAYGTDAFRETGLNGFVGGSGFFYQGQGSGEDASPLTGTPFAKSYGQALWMFQWSFAGTAATIVSGAVAERCSLCAYFVYSGTLSGFIYPIVVHMAWSDDGKFSPFRANRLFLGCGLLDFAGSGVVHFTGGVAALVATSFVGARTGRFGPHAHHLQQQSVIFQSLGTLILWFAWYGFNGGSSLAIASYGGVAAHVFMTTTLAAASSCLATAAIGYWLDNFLDPRNANNGILAGLVAITAGCATSNALGAVLTGLLAAPVYLASSRLLEAVHIDDVVDAFPVHGACGAWGLLAASLFATSFYSNQFYRDDLQRAERCAGLFYGGQGQALGVAAVFLLTTFVWTAGSLGVVLVLLHLTVGVRISENVEEIGLDDSKFGGHVDVPLPDDLQQSFAPAIGGMSSRRRRPPVSNGGDPHPRATPAEDKHVACE